MAVLKGESVCSEVASGKRTVLKEEGRDGEHFCVRKHTRLKHCT